MAKFGSQWLRLIVPLCFLIIIPSESDPTTRSAPLTHAQALEPLIYSHLTIECTIKSVRRQQTTLGELGSPSSTPDKEVVIRVAELSNVVVLRGFESPREVQISLLLKPESLVGKRLILCCYWLPKLRMFSVPFEGMAFQREEEKWLQVSSALMAPSAKVSATSQEVETLIHENDFSVLARRADTVVVGNVLGVVDSTITSSSDQPLRVQKIILEPTQILKGKVLQGPLSFVVSRGSKRTPWHTVTPMSFDVGETWIALLRTDGPIQYPIGGVNGLLLFKGNKVVFDRTFEWPYSRTTLTRAVVEAVNE